MKQIRRNVFETNSSSVHSITMCSLEDYEKWKRGELVYDYRDECLDEIKNVEDLKRPLTYDEFWEDYAYDYNTFYKECKTKNGDTVVAFGYHGNDY